MAIRVYTGDDELDRRFQDLGDKAMERISRNAVRRGLTVLRQAMQAAVPAAARTPGHQTLTIKKSIGQSLKKTKFTGITEGKAGAAVGIKQVKALRLAARTGKRRGVGISANNIHWYIMGTTLRHTGGRNRRGGVKFTGNKVKSTGIMPAHPAIRSGAGSAMPASQAMIIQSIRAQVTKEWGTRGGN